MAGGSESEATLGFQDREEEDLLKSDTSDELVTLTRHDGSAVRKLSTKEVSALLVGASIVEFEYEKGFITFKTGDGVQFSVYSNNNVIDLQFYPVDHQRFDLRIVDSSIDATVALVEKRLNALRYLYSVAYLLEHGLEEVLEDAVLTEKPIEDLIMEEDDLYLESASTGSIWVTIFTKSQKAYKTLKSSLLLLVPEGRTAVARRIAAETARLEAETALRELDVKAKEIEVKTKEFNFTAHQFSTVVELQNKIDKMKNPQVRSTIQRGVVLKLSDLGISTTPMLEDRRENKPLTKEMRELDLDFSEDA
jgi:hypothetical protein